MMEYKIRKSSYRCSRCDREFEKDEVYVSLVEIGEDELVRRDHCESCFELPEGEAAESIAFWRARRSEVPDQKKSIDFATLRELFFKMVESSNEDYRKVRYLLGLVLIRKRFIKLKEFVTEEGNDFLIVTTKQRKEPLKLEAPELHPSEFGELKERLNWLLDVDFDEEGEASLPESPEIEGSSAEVEGEDSEATDSVADDSAEDGDTSVTADGSDAEVAEDSELS